MKRGVITFLTVIVTLTLSLSAAADELSNAKNKLNDVNSSISEKQQKIKEIDKQKKSANEQLAALDEKMDATIAEINNLRKTINDLDGEVDGLAADIDKSAEEIETQQDLADKRLCALYKRGNLGYLNIILGANDFTDFVERLVYVKRVASMDRNLMETLEANKEALEEKKEELEDKQKEAESAKASKDKKLSELDAQSDEKTQLVKDLEKDKDSYEKLLSEEEAESKALKEKIKKIQQTIKVSNGKKYSVTGKRYSITSPYGWRWHPILKENRFHSGIDIGVPMNTPIYALKDGVVTYAGTMSGYGNVVMIHHGNIISLYAHNSSLVVSEGDQVKGGQLIAYSGSTGRSTGPHLHFELRNTDGDTIDPTSYYK